MKRLVAAGVKESWESGWQIAQGNEQFVIAGPIGDGERVWLEAVDVDRIVHKLLLSAEPVSLKGLRLTRYRVAKDASRAVEVCPTTVEIILSNGGVG